MEKCVAHSIAIIVSIMKLSHTVLAASLAASLAHAENALPEPGQKPENALELPDVDVIGVTPAVTAGLSRDKVSGNIQTAQVEPLRLSKARTAVLGAKRNPVDAGLVVCDNEDINRGHP
jgi:hypothetical protein